MPRRTNLLQRTIKLIEEAKGGFLQTKESELLRDQETGEEREVDIVLTGILNAHTITICFEVVGKKRKADSTWVEQIVRKHASLPTDKLILVSQSGFTKAARRKAEYNRAKVIDLSAGNRQLKNYLERAAFIQGATARVMCFVREGDKRSQLPEETEVQIGTLRKPVREQINFLLSVDGITKFFYESESDEEEQWFEVSCPRPVVFEGDQTRTFDEIFFIVKLERPVRVPLKMSSFNYDGVDYIYGTFSARDGSRLQFVSDTKDRMIRIAKLESDESPKQRQSGSSSVLDSHGGGNSFK